MKSSLLTLIVISSLFSYSMLLFAAEDASQIQKRFEDRPQPKASSSSLQIPSGSALKAPEGSESVTFKLNSIDIDGVTVYQEPQIALVFQDLIGATVSLKDIYDLAAKLTVFYTDDGYILSRVIVPPQSIRDGQVRLQAIEGYIDEVIFEGLDGHRPELFQHYENNLKASRPLNVKVLERYLLLANDLAGVQFETLISASASSPGASVLELKAKHSDFEGMFSLDNFGSESSGPVQAYIELTANDVFGLLGSTIFRYATVPTDTDELQYFQLAHSQTLNGEGLRLDLNYTSAETVPDQVDLRNFGTESESQSGFAGISMPYIRSRSENLIFSAGLTMKDSRVIGFLPSDDELTVLSLGVAYDRSDSFAGGGVNLVSIGFRQGLDVFGADVTSRVNAEETFGILDFFIRRSQFINDQWSADVRISGQKTDDALAASEQAGLGGEVNVRGYEPSEWTGDNLIAASLDLNFIPRQNEFENAVLYSFYDMGRLQTEYPAVGQERTIIKHSLGFGGRFAFTEKHNLQIELARTLDKDSEGNSSEWLVFARFRGQF